MDESAIVSMEVFNGMSREDQITALCDYHECNKKKRVLHREQYVIKRWNPHPPTRFVDWWRGAGVKQTEGETDRAWLGVKPVVAFNCEAVREVYSQAKSLGIA